jgi:DnaJ-class molecular chaperone
VTDEKSVKVIQHALKVLNLPAFVSFKEIKQRYRNLSKKFHPDLQNEEKHKMQEINEAYFVLKSYIEDYRFTFSKEEILKQFPQEQHASKFKF